LRGRSGRQGDPGSSRFYLSLQDDLMRIFASDKVGSLMKKLGMQPGEAIEHPWVTRAIENAQRKVEGHNFDMRKQLLEYDDVANDQRKVVYSQRNEMMASDDLSGMIDAIRSDVVNAMVAEYIPHGSLDEQWDLNGLEEAIYNEFGMSLPVRQWVEKDEELTEDGVRERIIEVMLEDYRAKEAMVGAEGMRQYEKYVMLQVLDRLWKEHLAAMDYLRQSIGLRGYAQKDPKQEYKRESFEMFSEMLDRIKQEAISLLTKVKIRARDEVEDIEQQPPPQPVNVSYQHQQADSMYDEAESASADKPQSHKPYVRSDKKLGRNEPCWCGSGKKFKQCHGKLT